MKTGGSLAHLRGFLGTALLLRQPLLPHTLFLVANHVRFGFDIVANHSIKIIVVGRLWLVTPSSCSIV